MYIYATVNVDASSPVAQLLGGMKKVTGDIAFHQSYCKMNSVWGQSTIAHILPHQLQCYLSNHCQNHHCKEKKVAIKEREMKEDHLRQLAQSYG